VLDLALGSDARARVPELAEGRRRVLVVNAKGGRGKTTIATNLAVFYANMGASTALVDHDPQGSATHWLDTRGAHLPKIVGIAAWKPPEAGVTRTFQMRAALAARRVVLDTPAAVTTADLTRLLPETDRILIPVLPSSIDIRAGTRFIGNLLLDRTFRHNPLPVTVIANRVRQNTLIFRKLERFLRSLDIPFVAIFRDTQLYVHAAEAGEGVFDSRRRDGERERAAFLRLAHWIETPAAVRHAPGRQA
jgi:chromosome partitioning protein